MQFNYDEIHPSIKQLMRDTLNPETIQHIDLRYLLQNPLIDYYIS